MNTTNLDTINELISEKQFEEAKFELEKILPAEQNNIEVLKLLGLCNVNLGFFSEGKKDFETVVKHRADDATSWFYLGNCYDNLDDFLHAKTAYSEVIKLRENYLDAYKNLGIVYIKSKEPEKAFELAKKALEISQEDYLLYYLAGTAGLAMGEYSTSIPYFEKAIEMNPTNSQLYNNLGTAYLSTSKYDQAQEAFVKASELDPKDSMTFYNIGSILQVQNKHKEACEFFKRAYSLENDEHYLVSLALAEFKSAQYEDAIRHYKKLVALHPEKHNFQYNLACCYEMMGEFTYAIGILDQLAFLNPKSKIMHQKLANLYVRTGQPAKAKEIYERIMTQGTVTADVYYEYAMICTQTGDLDIAEKILKKVVELDPNAAIARKDLGVIYLNKRLFDYAKDEFEQAYKIMPEDFGIIFEYANFLQATSDYKEAQMFYQKALAKAPKNPDLLIFCSLNEQSLNNIDKALEYIEQALAILPDDAFTLYLAGKANHLAKNYDKAQILLIYSWEKNPTPEVENLLALNYFEIKEYEKANVIFLKLLKDNPLNTTVLLNSAKCYEQLGDKESAEKQLNKILEVFPEMEEAIELKAKLGGK